MNIHTVKTKYTKAILKMINNQQNTNGLNKNLYNGMNGKNVPVWKFLLGLILLVGGIFLAINAAM